MGNPVTVSSRVRPNLASPLLASAAFGTAFVAVFHSNSVGIGGPGFSLEVMALSGRRALHAYFSGQNIALAMIAVPLLTLISFGLAAVARHPADGFLAMAVDLAGIGAGLALSNIFTATLPYPVEKRAGSPTPRAVSGYMGQAPGGTLGGMLGPGLAVYPGTGRRGAHPPVSGGRPDARAPAVRRRIRHRAGLDRRADRSPRSRAEAAGTLPDRGPQQAVIESEPKLHPPVV